MKKILIGSTASVAIVALAIGVLFYLGYLHLGLKSPDQRVSVSYHVCGSEMIDKYSRINTDAPDQGSKQLKDIAVNIKSTKHNEEDPTCQTMLFFVAFRTQDYQGMRRPMQVVQSMHDKGIYADNDLQVGFSVQAMNTLLKEVISDTKSS